MALNRKSLMSNVRLMVDSVSFTPDSGTDWEVNDNVVFAGTHEEVLVFALKKFDVFDTLIQEDYSIVWDRNYKDFPTYPTVPITLLGSIHVLPEEVTLVGLVSDSYRFNLSDGAAMVLEEKADPTNRVFYRGTRGALLSYLLQVKDGDTARIFTLYNFSIYDSGKAATMGMTLVDILGAQGPVELEKAHPVLANAIVNANIIR